MKTRSRMAPIVGLCLIVSACGDPIVSPDPAEPSFAVAGQSGCSTVQFRVQAAPIGPFTFAGDVTGDLEGTVELAFDPSAVTFAGVTIANGGTADWTITGGTLPAGSSFTTDFENRNLNVDRPGSPATLFENVGSHRAASGVGLANLTYRGFFTLDPVALAQHDYHGIICP